MASATGADGGVAGTGDHRMRADETSNESIQEGGTVTGEPRRSGAVGMPGSSREGAAELVKLSQNLTADDIFALSNALQRDAFASGAGSQQAVNPGDPRPSEPPEATWKETHAARARTSKSQPSMEEEIAQALRNNEFELFLQPQIALKSFSISGAEVLLRWRHRERGLVPPNEFLPLAEATHQICDIGRWVMRNVCENFKAWQQWMGPETSLAVNVSPVEMLDSRFLSNALAVLGSHHIPDSGVELELIETAVLANPESARDTISTLRRNGIRMALDDFGVGYSSLSSLRDYPFTKIKIDRSFVQHLGISQRSRVIVRSMIELGKTLQVAVNAEGVETPEQLQYLYECGCDEVQGYLFARPMPVKRFRDWTAGFQGNQSQEGCAAKTGTTGTPRVGAEPQGKLLEFNVHRHVPR